MGAVADAFVGASGDRGFLLEESRRKTIKLETPPITSIRLYSPSRSGSSCGCGCS